MSNLQADDMYMYQTPSTTDAKQSSYENQLLDAYEHYREPRSSVLTDPLVNRITWQTGQKATGFADLTKPLSEQIGGDHYRQGDIQPIEYIHANDMDFFSGNVVKYITRWKYKNGLEDLKKAKHYIELLMEQEYGYNG